MRSQLESLKNCLDLFIAQLILITLIRRNILLFSKKVGKMSNYGNFGMRRFGLFPPVLKALMVTNVVVFLVQYFMLSIFHVGGISLERLFMHYFALQPIYDGTGIMATTSFYPWQLITYQFMHAGFWHIFFNMFMLWMFGSELEELWVAENF